ncbi:MAG: flagellar protein FlgN [Gallionellaceae bacterium]|nr:MAG: flagellar protein FlgN [Gallionellaceae bacterium]
MTDPASADFQTQLNNERDALRAFIALLEKEQQALLQQDNDQLLALAEAKTQTANKLALIANTRRQFLNTHSANLDTAAWIQKYAPACQTVWDAVRKLAEQAHHLNQTNGEVIQLKLRSNQQALNTLLGATQSAAGLYGRDGQPNIPVMGRILGSG